MSEWATLAGLNNFGQWFKRTRYDASLWPPNLRRWFGYSYGFESKLTQAQFCEWLAEVSGDDTLIDYVYRIKTIESWADINSIKEARVKNIKEMNLHTALGMSGFLSMRTKDGFLRPIFSDNDWIFREVLKGKLNPITDKFPTHPIGRSAGPKLAAFIDGLVLANRGGSILDTMMRLDFALGNPNWQESDVLPGSWFSDLIEGKIFDVEMYDLEILSRCVQSYLRRYSKSTINFDVTDLIAVLTRDKKASEMHELPDLPPSTIGKVVRLYCLGVDVDYDNFIKHSLSIQADRWKKIEEGAKPTRIEIDNLSRMLNRAPEFFEDAWAADAANGLGSSHSHSETPDRGSVPK